MCLPWGPRTWAPPRLLWASPALRRQSTGPGARPLALLARRRRTTASALALTPLRSWGRQDPPPWGLIALACVKHLARGPHVIRAHLVKTDVIVVTGCWGNRGRRKRQPCLSGQSCWRGGLLSLPLPPPMPIDSKGLGPQGRVLAHRCHLTCRPLPTPPRPVAMDDEDGRCLLDVIW